MYIAVNYIGTDYTPGEVLPENLGKELIERLLKSGAIREEAPAPVRAASARADDADIKQVESAGAEDMADERDAEEIYEEPEAPVVDVMDALVEEPVKQPKKKGGKAK